MNLRHLSPWLELAPSVLGAGGVNLPSAQLEEALWQILKSSPSLLQASEAAEDVCCCEQGEMEKCNEAQWEEALKCGKRRKSRNEGTAGSKASEKPAWKKRKAARLILRSAGWRISRN
ncbi:hypothetical protein UY3_15398 [Chelonia mydas]|uniref:Uncharacterized protein n=1 Tax=Chelonia mydas TaxID=8469 RepID=M7AS68_CHEMY|nr:hypothetical protein UY3_15398 [Chelonia mydas]